MYLDGFAFWLLFVRFIACFAKTAYICANDFGGIILNDYRIVD